MLALPYEWDVMKKKQASVSALETCNQFTIHQEKEFQNDMVLALQIPSVLFPLVQSDTSEGKVKVTCLVPGDKVC